VVTSSLPGRRRVEHIMGLPILLDVRDDAPDESALEAAFDLFRDVDARFSPYRADSEISRLNRGELALAAAHPDVRAVLERCEELRRATHGYFDVRAASTAALDPSGLVKGWSVDRAATLLDGAGLRHYAISAGGDVLLRGSGWPDERWLVGIQHPTIRDRVAKVVDPHTRRPPRGVLSVTITGPDLATADAFATAAFAMGEAGPSWTARLVGYEALTILADGRVLATPGFPGT
jgi:thiamine biosynthesis lipoprotein